MHLFLLQNTKEGILKTLGVQTALDPSDFNYMDKKHFSNQNIFFYVTQKQVSNPGLEQHEGSE